MNTTIRTTFLSAQDLAQVQSILEKHGLSGFDASIRLWGRGKAIEVKGTLGRQELSCLLAIAHFLGTDNSSEAANESAGLPTAAAAIMGSKALMMGVSTAGQSVAA